MTIDPTTIDYKAGLWDHQADAYDFAANRRASMLAMDMGTGKTLVAIRLLQHWDARVTLILCPKSVLSVWRREFLKWAGTDFRPLILDTKRTAARKVQDAMQHIALHSKYKPVVVVNYETACQPAFRRWSTQQQTWSCVILDESHRAKDSRTITSRYCWDLRQVSLNRLCLTGTPMPHSPLDVYSQCRFLEPALFGYSFHRFRHQYAKLEQKSFAPVPIVTGYKNLDQLETEFAKIAFRVDASVLDLPEVQHRTIPCTLSFKAQKVYQQLEDNLIAEVEEGVVTAANALVKLLRLQQLTSGFTTIDGDELKVTEVVDSSKKDALYDFLDSIKPQESVVVFCRFIQDLQAVNDVATKLGRPYHELSGSRKELNEHAQMLDEPGQVLGVQIQAGGLGVDLTQARYAVYYSLGFSLGEYEQSMARLHRPGQERNVFFYHLLSVGTVDEKVYRALAGKQRVVDVILEALKKKEK